MSAEANGGAKSKDGAEADDGQGDSNVARPAGARPADARPAVALADVHSHLVPGVDDGAQSHQEALEGLDRLAEAGVDLVVTTPHVNAGLMARRDLFERFHQTIEAVWSSVVEACRRRHPDLTLHLGREVMLDVPAPELDDPRLRLNGGRYILVEFPRLTVPPESEALLRPMCDRGYVPVVAHVERYSYRGLDMERTLDEWRGIGAVLQVNAPSLMGAYGPIPRANAWEFLRRGWVSLLASDYHARGPTWLEAARDDLVGRGGEEQLRRLYHVNPRRVVADQPLEGVPPLGGW